MDGTGERGERSLRSLPPRTPPLVGWYISALPRASGLQGEEILVGGGGGEIFWVDRKRDGDDDEMTRRGGRLRLLGSGAETAVWAVNGGPVNALTVEPIKLVDREKKRASFIRLCLENMADSPLIEKRGLFFFLKPVFLLLFQQTVQFLFLE